MKTKRRSKRLQQKRKSESSSKKPTRKSKRVKSNARNKFWENFWKNAKSYEEVRRQNRLSAVFIEADSVKMATTIYSEFDEKSLTQRFIDTINEEVERVDKGGEASSISKFLANVGSKKRGTSIIRESNIGDAAEEYKFIQ